MAEKEVKWPIWDDERFNEILTSILARELMKNLQILSSTPQGFMKPKSTGFKGAGIRDESVSWLIPIRDFISRFHVREPFQETLIIQKLDPSAPESKRWGEIREGYT